MTADQVIARASRLISDPKNKRFTTAIMLEELNKILSDISSECECYKKSVDIQIQDKKRVYDFPVDQIRPVQMSLSNIVGELVFSTTYESMVSGGSSFNNPTTQSSQYHAFGQGYRDLTQQMRVFFRDLVSDNSFLVDPILEAINVTPTTDESTVLFG